MPPVLDFGPWGHWSESRASRTRGEGKEPGRPRMEAATAPVLTRSRAMMAELRREADRAAQESLRAMVAYMVKHGGKRNPLLEDAYRAAERVVDAVDEYESLAAAATLSLDPEAPHILAPRTPEEWAEADLRWAWGDR